MTCKLSGALGLALLAASFVFGGSVAYAQAPEEAASALPAAASEANAESSTLCVLGDSDAAACSADAKADALPTSAAPEIDQSPAAIEVEPSATDAPAPAVTSTDAIIVDIVETVTVATPGEDAAASEGPAYTGSIEPEASITPSASNFDEETVGSADAAAFDDLE